MSANHDTVLVVDDDPDVLDSMKEMLDAAGLTGRSYQSADAFLKDFDPARAGCAVLDVCMPDMDGLDLCAQLRTEHPDLPVIIVTGHGDVARARRSFKMGVKDFIEKPFSNIQLLELIRETLAERAEKRQRDARLSAVKGRIAKLSDREGQVLDLVVSGSLNKQIAAKLSLHMRTVEFHRRNIMKKMKADSVAELVEMILLSSDRTAPK